MNNRKRIIIPSALIIVLVSSLLSNNTLKNTRLVDIAQLVAMGVLLGVLIANLKSIMRKENRKK